MDRSQVGESIPTDVKQTHRLFPSLPNSERYDYVAEKLHTPPEFHPEGLVEVTQSGASAVDNDIRMKAQILILEEQNQELLSINEKWAKEYRTMVQYYKDKVWDLKALLQLNHGHFKEKVCEEGEMPVTSNKKVKFSTLERKQTGDVNSEAEKEAKELQVQNRTLTRRGQHQQEEIIRLNKALEEALQTTQPQGVSNETLQDLWKYQAEVYKEDFLKERGDKQKLKEKYLELKKRFLKVHTELCVLKSQVTWTRPPQPLLHCTGTNRAKSPN
uniref:TNFAIP3-interacting protein 1-like n=1 Tax=Monopterus albus TaxID=43700 RepID=UPI0009B377D4|nr:TNFAIP3-interacting protein 1-like [Monopterus albus]XP_020457926.1 TNFAIP3-interacting protein 1-like [Monopterus albus]